MRLLRFSLELVLVLVLSASAAHAVEIVGRVVNRTANQPVAGHEVTLLAMRGGMVALDTRETDSSGRFRFVVAANPNESFLVRVPYRGVNYHQPAVLAGGDRIEANVDVYEASGDAAGIERESHDFFLEPHTGHVRVTEVIVFVNGSKPPRSYVPESRRPLLVFRTPPDAGEDVRAFVVGPGGMPLRQQPQPGEEPNTHVLDYPLRPGNTQIEFSYVVPLANNRYGFVQRLPALGSAPNVVTPLAGIRLAGSSLGEPRDVPERQVRVYTARLTKQNELRFRIEVDPAAVAARSPAPVQPEPATPAAGEGSVTLIANPVAESKWYIVALTLLVLALGLYYLYSVPPAGNAPHESKSRR